MNAQITKAARIFCFGVISLGAAISASAQGVLELRSVRQLTNREVAFTASLPSNVNYRVETAASLAGSSNGIQWAGLLTAPAGPGSLQHTDNAAPYFEQRFYRIQQLTGATNLTGDHVTTTNGDVVLHPVNHASLVLQWKDLMIYNDPVGSGTLYALFPRPNLILVSHSHGDHYSSSTLNAVRAAGTIIIAPQAVWNAMSTDLRNITTVLTNGASTNVFGVRVEAVPAYNSNHARGSGNGYIVTIAGRRLLFSGDTGDTPELRALRNIDVAFIAMNLPFTMSITNAASLVREMGPKVVYPYHYRNGDNTFPDLTDFKRRVGQDLGIEVRLRGWY